MTHPLSIWLIFAVTITFLLVFDLGILHKKDHEISMRESAFLSLAYISIGLLYGVFIWAQLGADSATLYFTGFLIEKTLSLDNIFVIALIISQLAIPTLYQYRLLFFGVLTAIILRGVMISLGAFMVSQFAWILMVFALFLIIAGIKLFFVKEQTEDIKKSRLFLFLKRHLPFTDELHGNKFWVSLPDPALPSKFKHYFTRLFLALCLIELADIIFAVDSIPAIFAITTDTYIVYTSNIFAILGLRAMFFLVNNMLYRFHYLKYALALILIFIGAKVLVAKLLHIEKVPALLSLSVTVLLIASGILLSLYKTKRS
jgi:tellurite resistance protein TerC